jgi:hypothetical protein
VSGAGCLRSSRSIFPIVAIHIRLESWSGGGGNRTRARSRPSGNMNATASGQAKKTGHSEETRAAHEPPGSDPGCASSATDAYGLAASTAASDSAPTTRIQPIGLRACRATINAPTTAGAETAATRNGYNHQEPASETCCSDAIRSSTIPPAIMAKATIARHQAIVRRSTVRTPSFSCSGAPLATVLPPIRRARQRHRRGDQPWSRCPVRQS